MERAARKLQPSTILKREVALISVDHSVSSQMSKVLTLRDIVGFGVSTTIGSGIFVSVGLISRFYAGDATFVTFIIAAAACLLSALCYAEFGTKYPVAGQAYTYLYASVGELAGFVTGSLCFVTYTIATAAVSRGFASYFGILYTLISGSLLPTWMVATPPVFGFISFSALAFLLCSLCTLLALAGVREGSKVATAFAVTNVMLILWFTCYGGYYYADFANLDITSHLTVSGAAGIFKGVGLAYFCVIGWDLVLTLSEEVKYPSVDLPRGLILTISIVTLVYSALSIVLSAMTTGSPIDPHAAVADAFIIRHDSLGALVVSLVATSACISSVVSGVVGPPRIIYRMAVDGLLPNRLGELSARGVPSTATLLSGLASAVLSGLVEFEPLASITSCTALMIYAFVAVGILFSRRSRIGVTSVICFFLSSVAVCVTSFTISMVALNASVLLWVLWRWRQAKTPDTPMRVGLITLPLEEPFLCPWVPWLPLASVWVNAQMMAGLGIEALCGSFLILSVAIAIYFIYAQSHSALN